MGLEQCCLLFNPPAAAQARQAALDSGDSHTRAGLKVCGGSSAWEEEMEREQFSSPGLFSELHPAGPPPVHRSGATPPWSTVLILHLPGTKGAGDHAMLECLLGLGLK